MKKVVIKIVLSIGGILSLGSLIGILTIAFSQPILDDPPKPKRKEIKKDTLKIDIKQQQMVNAAQGMRSLEMDSIIMQIDSLKQKK